MCNRCNYNSPDNQIYVDPLTNEYYLDIETSEWDDTFDVFPSDFVDRGYYDKKKVEVRDLCSECYIDIRNYIHNKVFNRFKEEEESK